MLLSDDNSYFPPNIKITGACGVYADSINGYYEPLELYSKEGAPVYSKVVTADDSASIIAADRDGPMCLAYYGGDWNLATPRNVAKRDTEGNFTCTAFLQLPDGNEPKDEGTTKFVLDPVTAVGEWQVDQGEEGQGGFAPQPTLHLHYFCPCHTNSSWIIHQENLQQDVVLFWDMVDCICAFPSLTEASEKEEKLPITDTASLTVALTQMRRSNGWGNRHSKEFAILNSPDAKSILDAYLSNQQLLDIFL